MSVEKCSIFPGGDVSGIWKCVSLGMSYLHCDSHFCSPSRLPPSHFGISDHPTALYLHTSAKEVVILFTLQEPTPSKKTYDADKTTCRDIMSFGNAILWLSTLSYFIPKENIEETMSVILVMEMFVKYVCFQNIVPREDQQSTCDVRFIDMYIVLGWSSYFLTNLI